MKKVILCMIAIIVFGFANAQETKFGLKGGGNISNFLGDVNGFKSRVGFNVGVFVEIKLLKNFSIQPEILYSQQGAKLKYAGNFYDGNNYQYYKTKLMYNLGYINVPIMFKYYAIEKLAIEAGPQIGFLVSANGKTKVNGLNTDISIKDFYKTIDFGLNLGAVYDFTKNISVGARYNLGLSNIIKTEAEESDKVHNGVFSLSLGYKF
ncbi:PorT family protein [Flavobacterium psychroterrae]|uniref:PorT family protein n=1 Tax=Flavobacterium psychroterrae TaxID=2133767 RepID=A0ABS5PDD5_9FLAO|nr:porin family protein [Flavobacterium psychroterrae]MBS7232294.1 PorT family protein [Flavobacterium psychroterrae]